MFGLALRSLKYRTGGFMASFVAMFLGATILMTFSSMLDTSSGAGVDAASEETLVNMATIAGGWCLLIVVFAVVSTLTLTVRQRSAEMALLKSIGATPAQIGRMIVGETVLVALVAAVAAIVPAMLAGRLVFELLQDTDQVASTVTYQFGTIALVMGGGVTLLAATFAALVTSRRIARMQATEALTEATTDNPGMGRKRIIAAGLFLMAAVGCGTVTATVMNGEGSDAMQTAGQASIWASIGFALLAPALVRGVTAVFALPLRLLGGTSGYLTVQNVRQRVQQSASAVMPVILFTGIATGTIYMQRIENDAASAAGLIKTDIERNVETLNFVVVGMIAMFAAIMLINTLIASTTYRRKEFGQQRLVGATPSQVLRMVGLESLVLVVTGVLFGTLASLATVIPYTIARTDSTLPDTSIAIYAGIVAVAFVLTLVSSLGAAGRSMQPPAVEALAA